MAKKRDKKQKRIRLIAGFVVLIFLLSTFAAVVLYGPDDNGFDQERFTLTLSNGDYEFTRRIDNFGNPYYYVTSPRGAFTTYYVPGYVGSVQIEDEAAELLRGSPILYLTFNPEDESVSYFDFLRFELVRNSPGDRYIIEAVTEPSSTYAFPQITCLNATSETPVVFLNSGNTTNITVQDYCIDFTFAEYDIWRVRDLLVYSLWGVEI
jgi:hypothetical protein